MTRRTREAQVVTDTTKGRGFGLVELKKEGAAIHPDTLLDEWTWERKSDQTDKWYTMQLHAYYESYGKEETEKHYCSRPHLLKELFSILA